MAIQDIIKDVVAHGIKNENEEATREMVKGDGLIAELSKEITQNQRRPRQGGEQDFDDGRPQLSSTIITTVVIGVVGLADLPSVWVYGWR